MCDLHVHADIYCVCMWATALSMQICKLHTGLQDIICKTSKPAGFNHHKQ